MASLVVQDAAATVAARGDAILVRKAGEVVANRPVHEVDEVVLFGDVGLSASARRLLLRNRVAVVLLSPAGTYLGRVVPPGDVGAERRRAQYLALADPERAARLARAVVVAKLENQRAVLGRVGRNAPDRRADQAIAALGAVARRCAAVNDPAELLGLEGHGAAMYFRGFGAALSNPAFPFTTRQRRPPPDPVNAALSLGYTLLVARVESAIRAVGLDPYLGALHSPARGKPALALDLAEPLRPAVVDRTVLRLFNRRQVRPEDFVDPDLDPGKLGVAEEVVAEAAPRRVHLGPVARAALFRELGATWRERVLDPRDGQRRQLRDVVMTQAQQLAAWWLGKRDAFAPIRWR